MKKMFWVDMEMTGLDDVADRVLEIAVVITDLEFNEVETFHRIVYQPNEVLERMNDWCKQTHGKSGLTALVPTGVPIEKVDEELLALVQRHYPTQGTPEKVVLCGNSVGNDKRFIDRYLPKLASRCHYRIVDVSSFKEIFRSKYNVVVQKSENHRAIEDIRESINELKKYLSYVSKP